ncbi:MULTISPECIES: ExeM/NucH family extracellular endonuclease [Cryobacterium]|uniref:ExeM/NucH family extracellular endonuclease n=1 Tax=Cryobacterium breve TaxID=1259258 RepID=A0ABY2IZY6_9MICO|nr:MULTISPECIES: ExeM/NucH family extracellular endonuclease [Cryobacterium]TFC91723.1 ExeM/NucH family extracellular endonuclease [Cryobacterium sp. TmT3-12]TFC98272.1 ExeM/NucH family extracellular endonuclease [Cryobacterium breve]
MSSASRSHLKLTCATLLGLGLVVSPLVALPASANTLGTGVVINEAYLHGGSAGATYLNKFVELYNPTSAAVSLDGTSLQYRKPGGTAVEAATTAVALTGTIPAKGYYLVQGSSNGAIGAALPTPDATVGDSFGGDGGTLFLANSTTKMALPQGNQAGATGVTDLLGYGTSLTFETAVASAASVTTALGRTAGADADTNSSDFTLAAPTPTNKAGETAAPVTTAPPAEPPVTPVTPANAIPIREIQGTTDVSPKAGQIVTTTGVVTASYPTGGFKGFYLQAAGSGGAVDLSTHTASDGIFVYTNTSTAPVAIGDYLSITGAVSEFSNLTQLAISSLSDVIALDKAGIVAPLPATVGLPATDAARESLEGMLVAPQGDFTVTSNYTTNQYGDIGLAAGKTPLVGPTVTARPRTEAYTAAVAGNAARAVTLDDGATTNYLSNATNKGLPVPYLTPANPLRIGAAATFTKPVIFDFRNKAWKFQPTTELVPANAATVQPATFSNTRTAAPRDVGGDISLATFNVLNYFATTGDSIPGCTYYSDRAGTPITVNGGCDARGAATQVSFERQQAKIVSAINGLDAQVVSLLEIENSARFGKDRDFALKALVTALNAQVGSNVWAHVPSPAALPASEDVIRSGFIYKTAAVETVGQSVIFDNAVFANARQPLAQAFQLVGDSGSSFVAIANHFKSKGSGTGANADQGDGQGASNLSRVEQATALVTFADTIKKTTGIARVLLAGDFNAYDQEDPIKVITDAGYVSQEAKSGEYTYAFGGTVGSLDHVFASPEANSAVTDVDVWNINSVESVALEYSRYNNNVTDFYAADAFRSSDHDPAIVGLKLSSSVNINLLNINDFHGRIDANTVKFAGTIEQLRAEYGDAATLFLSDGDNIGATLFASASQNDKPTIDVLNALELKASGVGNHEFDQGFADLNGRVADAADFDYLGANVYKLGTTTPAMKEYALFEVNGVTVGVIGAVTQETPSLVSPNGIASLTFGDPVAAVNRVAAQLSDGNLDNGEADVLIAEYHEGAGAGTVENATLEQELALTDSAFAKIATQTSAKVDAIFTGHTHKLYDWDAQVPGAAAGVTRPVLQTGSYGEFIGQVVLNYDRATGATTTVENRNVPRTKAVDATLVAAYPRVAAVKTITDAAIAESAVIGSKPIGSITADITRACIGAVAPCAEDRSAPSAMGTLVANSLRESLSDPQKGGAEIGVVNPGGMRTELVYSPDGVVTYSEANAVLPFLNNLWTTSLTGAQFKTVLEQQWQRDAKGSIPSRPYLQLGLSDNVNYTFDASRAEGDRVTGIWIDGSAIDPARSYRVGSFNFLLTGGDNFREFKNGTNTRDSGLVDRDAWIAYLTATSPVTPSFAARQASVTGVPAAAVNPGATVSLTVSSLNLSSLGAPKNTVLTLLWPGSTAVLGTASVDAKGSSVVSFTVPLDAPADSVLELTAKESGTIVRVAIDVNAPIAPTDAPTSVGDVDADLENLVTTDKPSYDAGDPITVTVGEKFAGQYVWVTLDDTSLGGWLRANAQGQVTTVVPTDATAGMYRLVVQDAAGGVIGWTEIEVFAAAIIPTTPPTTPTPGTSTGSGSGSGVGGLAHTGVELAPLAAGGTLLLLLGGLLLARRRRVGFGES